jgi:hypothetical protein
MVLQRMTARARVQTAKFTDGSSRYSWCLLAPCAPQACTARIPASERLHPLPALVELDLSSFAFHLEMGDDDNAACAFLSTADHDGRGCQEMSSAKGRES